ncbi:MAG: hypothetical protein NC127_06270 [Muribaculum sp.]|nr:hypothetical protein [Muribaculum sp.]
MPSAILASKNWNWILKLPINIFSKQLVTTISSGAIPTVDAPITPAMCRWVRMKTGNTPKAQL